jgi:hypothetical protein
MSGGVAPMRNHLAFAVKQFTPGANSPLHPAWVARRGRRYAAAPCAPQKDSTTTSETPSAAT